MRGSRLALPAAVLVVAASAVLLSFVAHEAGPLPGDRALAIEAQRLPSALARPARALQALSATEAVVAAGLLVAGSLFVRGRRREAVVVAVAVALLPLVQWSLKELVDRPRPPADVLDHRAGFSSPSFPSGHAMSGTLGLMLAWMTLARGGFAWGIAAAAGAALNGAASIYLGVHWPSDVLGGLLWAAVLGLAALWVLGLLQVPLGGVRTRPGLSSSHPPPGR